MRVVRLYHRGRISPRRRTASGSQMRCQEGRRGYVRYS